MVLFRLKWKQQSDSNLIIFHIDLLLLNQMTEIKDLKREHKKLETITKKAIKERLNDRASDSWKNLRELKKLKLQVKDRINQLKC